MIRKYSLIYISSVLVVFLVFTVVFDFFPRSTVSELEKRELKTFPVYSEQSLRAGIFTQEVSSWFSDTEPFRDRLMTLSMNIKSWQRLVTGGDENVSFHASAAPSEAEVEEEEQTVNHDVGNYENNITANENAKIANAGIIIVGQGEQVRALMAFGGSAHGGTGYSDAANAYKRAFGDKVHVYCMVIPTAVEFYCPEKARKCTHPQAPTINNIHAHLDPDVQAVDIYTTLAKHVSEPIYLRTDHHWAPLGAFYAAQKFAEVAKVPFKSLEHYTQKVVHRYVGSMYGYSKDVAIKNAPEDFVYYEPKEAKYTTTYIDYDINKNYQVVGEKPERKGIFFYHYRDGQGGAYCTFMGGDTRITCVRTDVGNHRRVLILKDSFGNAIPGFLFYSFEEIHVVDFRYFTKNMKQYVKDNKITDILFANNIFNAYSSKLYRKYIKFLDQTDTLLRQHKSDRSSKGDSVATSRHGERERVHATSDKHNG